MKRSEMENLIEQHLYDMLKAGAYSTDMAKHIIDVVEEAGMLPPKSKDYLPPATEDFMSEAMGHKWDLECDCGSTKLPIQKLGGLICADCRKVI